jgi:hypothetical protein
VAGGDFTKLNKELDDLDDRIAQIMQIVVIVERPISVQDIERKRSFKANQQMISDHIRDLTDAIIQFSSVCSNIQAHLPELQLTELCGKLGKWQTKKCEIESIIDKLTKERNYWEKILLES